VGWGGMMAHPFGAALEVWNAAGVSQGCWRLWSSASGAHANGVVVAEEEGLLRRCRQLCRELIDEALAQ